MKLVTLFLVVAALAGCKLEGQSGTVGLECQTQADCQDDTLGCVPVDDKNINGTHVCMPPPTDWKCEPKFFGDGLCDCGCGFLDDDCAARDSSVCELPAGDHCKTQTPPKTINPTDNTLCQ
jgi:hypothetical protein